jgi:heterodisulfide reductase subunit A-like polyferredoxin
MCTHAMDESHQLFNSYLESSDLSDIITNYENIKASIPQGHVPDIAALKSFTDSHTFQEFCTIIGKRLLYGTDFEEKKLQMDDYAGSPCKDLSVLVVGAGPAGLRTAIEARMLGAQVVVAEQRANFSRNNVTLIFLQLMGP